MLKRSKLFGISPKFVVGIVIFAVLMPIMFLNKKINSSWVFDDFFEILMQGKNHYNLIKLFKKQA